MLPYSGVINFHRCVYSASIVLESLYQPIATGFLLFDLVTFRLVSLLVVISAYDHRQHACWWCSPPNAVIMALCLQSLQLLLKLEPMA